MNQHTHILVGLSEVQIDLGLKGDHDCSEKVRQLRRLVHDLAAQAGAVPSIIQGYRDNALEQCSAVKEMLEALDAAPVNDQGLLFIKLAAEQLSFCIETYLARKATAETATLEMATGSLMDVVAGRVEE